MDIHSCRRLYLEKERSDTAGCGPRFAGGVWLPFLRKLPPTHTKNSHEADGVKQPSRRECVLILTRYAEMRLQRLASYNRRVGGTFGWILCFVSAAVLQLSVGFHPSPSRHPFGAPFHPHSTRFCCRQPSFLTASSKGSSSTNGGDDFVPKEQDWRAFRARLVQMDKKKSLSLDDGSNEEMTTWAYDAGMNVEVGTVLLSIPTTDLCQALEQQYFHRCVLLVTKYDEKGTRGILLNRPTAFTYKSGDDDYEWPLWFGGDMYENHIDDDEEIICLHSLTSQRAMNVSELIERGLSYTTLAEARNLVKDGIATPSNFWCFGGHCCWHPGQLEQEMGPARGEWFAASLDATSIWSGLRHQAQSGTTSGKDMWELLIDRIDKHDEAISHIPSGQLRFYDQMLQAWVDTNLILRSPNESVLAQNMTNTASRTFEPGTLVRATMKAQGLACPPFLLSEQEFHRSIILVLSDTDESTVGVHLNLPLSGVVQVTETITMPIRYGGPVDAKADLEEDDDSFVWIHRSPELTEVGEGTPLGKSGFWNISEDDAVEALQSGDASPDDFMIFSGMCIWEKGEDLGAIGGGLAEQVDALKTMEVVSPSKADSTWSLLTRQEVLTKETLDNNLKIAIYAWESADENEDNPARESGAIEADDLLADAALRAWAAVSLLDEPTTTLIEVPET